MSISIDALSGVQEVMKQKFPKSNAMNPDYFKQSDVNSTSHFYSQTTVLENGKSLTVHVTCVFIPYGRASYEIGYTVEGYNKPIHKRVEVERQAVSVEGVLNVLRDNGLKI